MPKNNFKGFQRAGQDFKNKDKSFKRMRKCF